MALLTWHLGDTDYWKSLCQGSTKKLLVPQSRNDIHLHSLFPWAIRPWNRLPPQAFSANNLTAFMAAIGRLGLAHPVRSTQPMLLIRFLTVLTLTEQSYIHNYLLLLHLLRPCTYKHQTVEYFLHQQVLTRSWGRGNTVHMHCFIEDAFKYKIKSAGCCCLWWEFIPQPGTVGGMRTVFNLQIKPSLQSFDFCVWTLLQTNKAGGGGGGVPVGSAWYLDSCNFYSFNSCIAKLYCSFHLFHFQSCCRYLEVVGGCSGFGLHGSGSSISTVWQASPSCSSPFFFLSFWNLYEFEEPTPQCGRVVERIRFYLPWLIAG